MVQTFQIITKNLSKTTDNKQSLKIYLKIGWNLYQVGGISEKLLGKVSKLWKRSGNSLLFLIEIFTPDFRKTLTLKDETYSDIKTLLRSVVKTYVHKSFLCQRPSFLKKKKPIWFRKKLVVWKLCTTGILHI